MKGAGRSGGGNVLPPMIPIRQHLDGARLDDVPGAMREALGALGLTGRITAGMTVGIPVGSRGIRNIAVLVGEAVRHVRGLGANPVIVAAMGSHGGGTVAGQIAVLRSLGITEASVGAPVIGNADAVA